MKRYRFKTKEEFIEDDLWDYDFDCPNRWNSSGEMNHYMGKEITDPEIIKHCTQGNDFTMDLWHFRMCDYVKIEQEDYSGRQVRALIDNPHSTSIKKGDIITLTKRAKHCSTIYNGVMFHIPYPLDLNKWEVLPQGFHAADEPKYYPDLSQHIGRYIKALVDNPHGGGSVKAGEYGRIRSHCYADFPNFEEYACSSALCEGSLGKYYELMPEGFVPLKNRLSVNELIEEAKRRYPIGSRVSNKNLGLDCDFNIDTHDFSEDTDDSGIVVKTKEGYFTVYSKYLDKWADVIYEPNTFSKQFEVGKWYTNPEYPENYKYFRVSSAQHCGYYSRLEFDALADENWNIVEEYRSQANSDFEKKMELVDHMSLIQEEAKRRFPIGSYVIPIGTEFEEPVQINYYHDVTYRISNQTIWTDATNGYLFIDNRWAQPIDHISSIIEHQPITIQETQTPVKNWYENFEDTKSDKQLTPVYSTTIKLKSKKSSKTLKL